MDVETYDVKRTNKPFLSTLSLVALMSEQCVFCRIVKGQIPAYRIWEDDRTLAFLDINPSSQGHSLVIPKTHVSRLRDLAREDSDSLFRAVCKLTGPIQDAAGADACSVGINDGEAAGQEVPHIHVHIIPRKRRDGGRVVQSLGSGIAGTQDFKHTADEIVKRI